jgi:hypothetical protein
MKRVDELHQLADRLKGYGEEVKDGLVVRVNAKSGSRILPTVRGRLIRSSDLLRPLKRPATSTLFGCKQSNPLSRQLNAYFLRKPPNCRISTRRREPAIERFFVGGF